jgi:hypothetical protein
MVSGLGTDAQDHRAARLGAGRAGDGHALMAKSAKPDAAATIARSLTARQKVALSSCMRWEIRGLISREHASRYAVTDDGRAVLRAILSDL